MGLDELLKAVENGDIELSKDCKIDVTFRIPEANLCEMLDVISFYGNGGNDGGKKAAKFMNNGLPSMVAEQLKQLVKLNSLVK